jgi:hypothetical protein
MLDDHRHRRCGQHEDGKQGRFDQVFAPMDHTNLTAGPSAGPALRTATLSSGFRPRLRDV